MSLTRRQTLAAMLAGGGASFAREAEAADAVARLTFLLVNDVYELDTGPTGRGGFPRLATVVAAERARARDAGRTLVFVHAGDTLSPSLMSSLDQGAHMIALFDALGLDIFVPGNHEFDFGTATYLRRMGEARFKVLAANLRDAKGAPLPGHRDDWTLEVAGAKIAFVGSAYDATIALSNASAVTFAPTPAAVRGAAAAVRASGADFVVAVIHADKAAGAAIMASHVADLVLSGHNHDLHIDFDGRTAFAESSQDADFVTAIDIDVALKLGADGTRSVAWWPQFRITDTAHVAPDPAMQERVRGYEAEIAKTVDIAVALIAAPLDSRRTMVRSQEAAIGNLFADAIRLRHGAEVAIVNGGGIRGDTTYAADTAFTRRLALTELPFGNKTIVTEVTGAALHAALENGLSAAGRPAGRFPQVSGMRVKASASAPLGGRVSRVMVAGAPLDPARTYRLATLDYLARGGDGYGMLAGSMKVTIDSGTTLYAQDVVDHAARLKTIDTTVDGRMQLAP